MVDVDDLTIATNKRVRNVLEGFPSAITRNKDTNIFRLLQGILKEYEILNNKCLDYLKLQDLIELVNKDPLGVDPELDRQTTALVRARRANNFLSGDVPESNASYWTNLITARHIRLSDGSMGDIANYIHALSGLGNPLIGNVPIYADNKIISVYKHYNKEEFVIHERWKSPDAYTWLWSQTADVPDVYKLSGDTNLLQGTPTCNTTFSPSQGNFPLAVNFLIDIGMEWQEDTVQYTLEFGDGTTATQLNNNSFSHSYSKGGNYTIISSARNERTGQIITQTINNAITVRPCAPVADFTYTLLESDEISPNTYKFTDISLNMGSGNGNCSWYWDFGDGGFSTLQHPTHTYDRPGIFTVSLLVTNNLNTSPLDNYCVKTDLFQIYPENKLPISDFTSSTRTGFPPMTVTFYDNSKSNIGPDYPFGVMGVSSGLSFFQVYLGSTVIPPAGITVTFDYDISIISRDRSNVAPSTSFKCGLYILLILEGMEDYPYWRILSDTQNLNLGHVTFSSYGDYHGYRSIPINQSYWVNGILRKVKGIKIGAGILTGIPIPDDTIFVHGAISNLGYYITNETRIIHNQWIFGDPHCSVSENTQHDTYSAKHTYTEIGEYTVILKTITPDGEHTITKENYVKVLPRVPIANFIFSPASGSEPLTVQFTDTSINMDGDPASLVWLWDFGDPHCPADDNQSLLRNPTHTYTVPGTYTVTLSTINALSEDSIVYENCITVSSLSPIVDFTANQVSGTIPFTVSFENLTQNANLLGIEQYLWNFGDMYCNSDQNQSTLKNPTHTYTVPGTYTVTLTAINGYGDNTLNKIQYISAQSPVSLSCSFTASNIYGVAPVYVEFLDTSTGDPTSWLWDFGDGSISTDQNPLHIYRNPGEFTVKLTISKPGHSNVMCQRVKYIEVISPHEEKPGHGHSFWIEFIGAPRYPIDVRAALDGVKALKPAGVCFRGFVFNTEKVKALCNADLSPYLLMEAQDHGLSAGGVTCIAPLSKSTKWGHHEWGQAVWGHTTNRTRLCDNTVIYYLLHLGFNKEINAFLDTDPSTITYDIHHYAGEIHTTSSIEANLNTQSPPTSQTAGGVFCTYEGYGDGGYGGVSDYIWNYYEREYFETCWKHATVLTGLGLPRRTPFTEEELALFGGHKRDQIIQFYPHNWISTSGIYKMTPWGSSSWGGDKWDKDFTIKERENECIILIELFTYAPTMYLTTGLPAPHVLCPKDTNLRGQEQIELDCIFVSDDTVTLFEDYGETDDPDKPLGASADSECILFDISEMPDIVWG